jgi:hypothetical protein
MSKAAELAALIGSQTALSNRNVIINGAMQVAQRNTSVSGISSGSNYQTVDRWIVNASNLGTWTVSQSSDAPDGFTSSQKYDCTTADASPAAGDYLIADHRIEAQDLQHLGYGTSAAKKITVSFYVKSNKTGTYIFELTHSDASIASNNQQTYTINSANTWERKSITFVGNTTDVINNDNGIGLFLFWWLGAGSDFTSGTLTQNTWANTSAANRAAGQVNLADSTDNEWLITGVQLELGEQTTPFEHRSFGDELARCQRYFGKMIAGAGGGGFGTGMFNTSTNAQTVIKLPRTMRTDPSVSFSDLAVNDAQANINVTAAAVLYVGSSSLRQDFTVASGGNQYRPVVLQATGSGSFVAFDAEL